MATKGILGEKLGMTQVFDENNRIVPVTVVKAGPCVVTQIRTVEKDGYTAVQLAYGQIDPRKVTKPVADRWLSCRWRCVSCCSARARSLLGASSGCSAHSRASMQRACCSRRSGSNAPTAC